MKKIYFFSLIIIISFFSMLSSSAQVGEWVWIHGDSTVNKPANYGTKGVSSPTNNPPSVYEACEWTDVNGNFWLFGGLDNSSKEYGDLWKYDTSINQWTWMKGSGIPSDPGSYGIKGVSSPSNYPGARSFGSTTWTDKQGNLWMYGGSGSLAYSDLWKYNVTTNEWTWMQGPNTSSDPPVYGTLGVPSPTNTPGYRSECAASWTDDNGDLWMFGGFDNQHFNDLWRYNIASNQWTWMKGSSLHNQPGIYGTKGVEAAANTPGGRAAFCHWKDGSGNLWFLGGFNVNFGNDYNDLWRYNPTTNRWAWMGGNNTPNMAGVYGTNCIGAAANTPGARAENRAACTDQNGNFWLFGGSGHAASLGGVQNDLWMYCISSKQWVYVSGSSTFSPTGNWGTLNVSSPLNIPDGRCGNVSWADQNGHLYFFGGSGVLGYYNDLWMFTIDPSCGVCASGLPAAHFTASDSTICSEGNNCINFFDHSSGNPISWKWLFPGASPDTSSQQNPSNICYFQPGTYAVTLIVTNSTGTDTLKVTPLVTVGTTPPAPVITLQGGDTLICSHASSYQWYYNGVPIPSATDSFYVALNDGTYNVYITDNFGCSRLGNGFTFTYVNESPQFSHVRIYPNPNEGTFRISFAALKETIYKIQLINMLNETAYQDEQKFMIGSNSYTLDASFLPAGIYILRLHAGHEVMNHKIIIAK